jgi:hypothetical protein
MLQPGWELSSSLHLTPLTPVGKCTMLVTLCHCWLIKDQNSSALIDS